MTETSRHSHTASDARTLRPAVLAGPYAGPARLAVLDAAPRTPVSHGVPYVPAPFRTQPRSASAPGWPDEQTGPGQGGQAGQGQEIGQAAPGIAVEPLEDSVGSEAVPPIEAFLEEENSAGADIRAETWMIEEAGAHIESLSESFGEAQHGTELPAAAASTDMPMWTGDEWMDVLPIQRASAAESLQAAHVQPSPTGEDSEAAAAAEIIESIALRIRTGELSLPGYKPSMGDAAALAATLTALLGRGR